MSPSEDLTAGDTVTITMTMYNPFTPSVFDNYELHFIGLRHSIGPLRQTGCTAGMTATLWPGNQVVCTYEYTVTSNDVRSGGVRDYVEWRWWYSVLGIWGYDGGFQTYAQATTTPSQVTLTGSATPSANARAGDTITYAFHGENTGRTELHDLQVVDPTPGLGAFTCQPALAGLVLPPTGKLDCSAPYTVTHDDVARGRTETTATIVGTDPRNRTVNAVATASATTDTTAELGFVLTSSPTSDVVAGTVVTFQSVLTNQGGSVLTSTRLTDTMPGLSGQTCDSPESDPLLPGRMRVCTATYTVTQADVDAGSITNQASAQATFSTGTLTRFAAATVLAGYHPAITASVTADPGTDLVVGQRVGWTMVGHNAGDVTVHDTNLQTPMPGLTDVACSGEDPLPPNHDTRCTGTSIVTQADVDAGQIVNAITFGAVAPRAEPVQTTADGTATTTSRPELRLSKTASPAAGVRVGDLITYDYTATNTGTVTVRDVAVADPHPGLSELQCAPAPGDNLAPASEMHCTATYTATQADVDAGSIVNTATAIGRDPHDAPVVAHADATVTTDTTATLIATKSAAPASGVRAGDRVTYTVTGTNSGSATVHDVTVSDPLAGLSPFRCTPAAPAVLAPGATLTCTADYTVTQADVDAGGFPNTATVHALDPRNNAVSTQASTIVTASEHVDATFTKSVTPAEHLAVGDRVTYTLRAANNGDRSLTDASITDLLPGLGQLTCTPSIPARLAPGDDLTCTADATVTQADVDAGGLTNSATFTATSGGLPPIERVATARFTTDRRAAVTVEKTARPSRGVEVGETVEYSIQARNTGTVTLHDVQVTDPMPGLVGFTCTPPAPARIAPGEAIDCTARYTVTQADVDAGTIRNTATATATPATGDPVTGAGSTTVRAHQRSALSLTKTATPDADLVAGDVITYDVLGQNTGTVSLHDVTIADPMAGLSPFTCDTPLPATLPTLATVHCSATYTVTQADIDAGRPITNTATIQGFDPGKVEIDASARASATTSEVADLTLTKTAAPATDVKLGDVLTYSFFAQNTGAVSEHDVMITDPMPGLSPLDCTPAAPATLAAGETMVCTATATVTQADVDAGSISNTAALVGSPPNGPAIHATAASTVTADTTAALSIDKIATTSGPVIVGSAIDYSMHATNTGAVTVHDVTVTDPLLPGPALTCTPSGAVELAPGAAVDCRGTYTATQADIDLGTVLNVATVAGSDPRGNPVSAAATAATPTEHVTAIALTKFATPTSGLFAGSTVVWAVDATNSGNVTLHDVRITDDLPSLTDFHCRPDAGGALAPGATRSCRGASTVTAADVAAGTITNTATVMSLTPQDLPIAAAASRTILAGQTASLRLTKSADPVADARLGDLIRYTLTATNEGTVPLHDVRVVDDNSTITALRCSPRLPRTLAVGESVICTTSHTVAAVDIAVGHVDNAATATGLDPVDNPTSAAATVRVSTTERPDPGPPVGPTPGPPSGPSEPGSKGTAPSGTADTTPSSNASTSTTAGAGTGEDAGGTAGEGDSTSGFHVLTRLFDSTYGRIGGVGALTALGGWFFFAAVKRREDDEAEADAEPLNRRERRERRKWRNRILRRRPTPDRRTRVRRWEDRPRR